MEGIGAMIRRLPILLMLLAWSPVLQAVLPRNAEFRQKDVFEYRQRKQDEFKKAQQQHDAQMVSRDLQIRRELASSPWNGSPGTGAAFKTDLSRSGQVKNTFVRHFQKWTISIIALLFIVAGVWWVRISTESEQDK
jgi:hypothetical protein